MKSLLSLGLIVLALSFCNLMGRRKNTNANNTQPSRTSTESSDNNGAASNSNTAAPAPISAAPPGVRTLQTNQNTAANAPPPPPRTPISGGILNGRATYLPKPSYPAIAKAAHASGQVNVQVLVDEDGNVISATPVTGHPLLRAAAAAAARQAKFTPTKLSGQPVKVTGILIYTFTEQ